MATGGLISTIITIGLLILAVLALFMPFFVMQIRDRTKSIDKKLSTLIDLLREQRGTALREGPASASKVSYDKQGRKIKECASCGRKNRGDEYVCTNCGAPI